MIDSKHLNTHRELVRVWVTSIEETVRDFFPQPREFCVRVYENASHNLMNIFCNEYGLKMKPAKTIKEAIESYIDLCVQIQLFEDASQFILKEVNPNKIELTVFKCVYLPSCMDILERSSGISDLTCPRIGCFVGGVGIMTNIPCTYGLTVFDPSKCCQGFIERI
jgi:hypothetical protein